MKIFKIATLGAVLLFAWGGVEAQQTQPTQREQSPAAAQYIERYGATAIAHMEKYGIPASIKMAQGMLESDCGRSRLATEANNHFGIKCKTGWQGDTIHHNDDEAGECFRAYDSDAESWIDHSEFLDKGARYQFLFELDPTDYKAWARGLKDAGYATNPAYPELLVRTIEQNQLWQLDRGQKPFKADITADEAVKEQAPEPRTGDQNGIDPDHFTAAVYNAGGYAIHVAGAGVRYVIAAEGDTVDHIARQVGLSARKLRLHNDLGPEREVAAGDVLYLEAKNNRPPTGPVIHTAREGETLHSVAQRYALKVRELARRNGLPSPRVVVHGVESGTYFEPLRPQQLIKL